MKRSSFSHEIDDFRNAIDAARQRIAELENPIIEESALFEELTTTMEELQVADEELHAQDEALDAAYASLAASHKHYQDLFEAAPWVYLLTDTNGVIREANKEAGRLFNMDRQYLIGKPLTLYLDKADKSFFRQQIQVLLKSSDVHRWEMTVLPRHDAPPIPVAVICVKAVEDFSIHNHLRWLLYDLTLQKKAEETEREKIFRSSFDQVGVGVAYLSPEGKWLRVNKKLTNMLGYTADELLETDYRDLTDIEDIHASIDAHLQLMSRQAETVSVEKRFHRKDGSVLWASVTSSLITDSSQRPIYIISVIEDITIRKQIELAANAKHETAELLQTTGTQLTSTLQLNEVLELIVRNLKQVVPYDAASLFLVEDRTVSVVQQQGYVEAGLDDFANTLKGLQFPVDVLKELLPPHPVLMDQQVHNSLFKILPQADCIQSALFVPLMNVDAPIGFLLLQRLGANPFDGQQSALTIFANQAVIAIQNAKLYQVSQELAVLEERHRVARDLHDSVSQTLFSSVVITEILSRSLNKKHDVIQSHLEDLETLNRSALAEMRLLLFELRPEQLLSTNLQDRVLQLIDATKGRKKLIFDIQIEPSPGIPSKVLAVFFRIIQESLNNIIKHSFARRVKIQLRNLEDQFHLAVQDDGVGFNMDEAKSGFGFSSMSERAQEIGADLKVISEPQHGTQVSLIWKKP